MAERHHERGIERVDASLEELDEIERMVVCVEAAAPRGAAHPVCVEMRAAVAVPLEHDGAGMTPPLVAVDPAMRLRCLRP